MPFVLSQLMIFFVILIGWTGQVEANEARTIYSNIEIPEQCHSDYLRGGEVFGEAILEDLDTEGQARYFDEHLAAVRPSCDFYYSQGVFDAQGVFHQQLLIEFLLELRSLELDHADLGARDELIDWFSERFAAADLDSRLIDHYLKRPSEREAIVQKFIHEMSTIAATEQRAVPFRRFIFVSGGRGNPHTLYEYRRSDRGGFFSWNGDEPEVEPGSYQKLASNTWQQAVRIAEEYLAWRPSLIYGKDSWLWGAFWRWRDPSERSLREITEEGFFTTMARLITFARQNDLNLEPFLRLKQAMIEKSKHTLDSEIKAFDQLFVATLASPLVPVGMAIGSVGFGYIGLESMSLWSMKISYTGASFAHAANVSGLISLSTMAGFAGIGAYNAVQDYRQNAGNGLFRLSFVADHIVGATVASFPLAATLPAVIGGSAGASKYMFVDVKQFLAAGMQLSKHARALGWKGSLTATSKFPVQLTKAWGTAWWTKKVLYVHYIADLSMASVVEIGYRQLWLDGEDRFLHVDHDGNWHFNRQSIITIGTSAVAGVITKPLVLIPTVTGRTITYQSLNLISGTIAQLAAFQMIDPSRLKFDQYWGLVVTPIAENERGFRFAEYVIRQPKARQTAMVMLMNLAVRTATKPLHVYFLDRHLNDFKTPVGVLREIFYHQFEVLLDDFSDEELDAAVVELLKDDDLVEYLVQLEQE